MGSDSDLPTMQEAAKVLKQFEIPYEIGVYSAHRSPHRTADYVRTARDRGLKLIIAGAGSAAHLAGVTAAETTLPVIGVPIDSSPLSGFDAASYVRVATCSSGLGFRLVHGSLVRSIVIASLG